jgi:hypothetical protein
MHYSISIGVEPLSYEMSLCNAHKIVSGDTLYSWTSWHAILPIVPEIYVWARFVDIKLPIYVSMSLLNSRSIMAGVALSEFGAYRPFHVIDFALDTALPELEHSTHQR